MKNNDRNIRVFGENNDSASGFNIYLDFSGRREYLMSHRHNGLLYGMLKDGVCLGDIKRWKPGRGGEVTRYGRRSRYGCHEQLSGMVDHLLGVIDDYLLERMAD